MAHVFGTDAVGFSTLAGWAIQSNTINKTKKRAKVLNSVGNGIVSTTFDDVEEVSTTYKAAANATPTVPATLGAVINGYTLTSITLNTTADDYVEMTLSGHKHVDGTHGTVRTVSHGITLDSYFGASGFGVAATESSGLFSSTCTISCQHTDVPGATGNTIVGENYDATIEVEVTATGTIATGALPATYDRITIGTPQGNAEHLKQSVSLVKDLTMT